MSLRVYGFTDLEGRDSGFFGVCGWGLIDFYVVGWDGMAWHDMGWGWG